VTAIETDSRLTRSPDRAPTAATRLLTAASVSLPPTVSLIGRGVLLGRAGQLGQLLVDQPGLEPRRYVQVEPSDRHEGDRREHQRQLVAQR